MEEGTPLKQPTQRKITDFLEKKPPIAPLQPKIPPVGPFENTAHIPSIEEAERNEIERVNKEDDEMREGDYSEMEIMEHWEAAAIELHEKFGKSVNSYRRLRDDLPMSWVEYEKRDGDSNHRLSLNVDR